MPQHHSDLVELFAMSCDLIFDCSNDEIIDVDYIDMTDAPITDTSRLLPEHTIILYHIG